MVSAKIIIQRIPKYSYRIIANLGGLKMWETKRTNEGAEMLNNSGDACVEFFAKAGSLLEKANSFYENESDPVDLFKKAFEQNDEIATKLAFWLRDPRGGSGNRSAFRRVLNWLALNHPEYVKPNVRWIPEFGRWDDLRALFGTSLEDDAAQFWANAINKKHVLAAKWADRSDYPIRKKLGLKIGDFRRELARIRSNQIVESAMCENQWEDIEYQKVPSVAMARYTNAFKRHDPERFEIFKSQVESGEKKVHADVLFPHDCIRTARNGDKQMADAQFDSLPNFMPQDEMVMVIADSSGSMTVNKAGSVKAIDVSMGMALYCSSKVPENHPFYKRFIAFCSEGRFVDWRGMKMSEAVFNRKVFDGAVGSTRIDLALNTILEIAKLKDIPQRLMPSTLIIVSDMQFTFGGVSGIGLEVKRSLNKWLEAGYETPKIVYWNTSGYAGSQATAVEWNTAMVSGFSPSILKSIFEGDDFSPRGIMLKSIEKYDVIDLPK